MCSILNGHRLLSVRALPAGGLRAAPELLWMERPPRWPSWLSRGARGLLRCWQGWSFKETRGGHGPGAKLILLHISNGHKATKATSKPSHNATTYQYTYTIPLLYYLLRPRERWRNGRVVCVCVCVCWCAYGCYESARLRHLTDLCCLSYPSAWQLTIYDLVQLLSSQNYM